jgi:uncharacterized protein
MRKFRSLLTLAFLLPWIAPAQATQTIQAVGSATVSGQPDQVKVDLGVTTTATTAQDASQQNATLMTAVIAQVQSVLGAAADIKTIGYSITPNYRTTQGSPPVLTGYTAVNTVEVTARDSASIVKVIDSVSGVGATNITNLHFSISNDEPLREQALSMAAKQAIAHAQAIASGLGAHIGAVISAQEGVSVTPIGNTLAPAAASTPVLPGLIQVTANVTIAVALTQ